MQRLEVRLEPERHERLRRLAEARGESMSDVVRDLIDAAYTELDRADRLAAVDRLAELELFEVGTPDELKREILTMWDEDSADLP
jgi:predicted DNA-binding protein